MARPRLRFEVPFFAALALLLGGFAGDHSDLAIQRALVAARLWPDGWPDDLVIDHAAAHPGLLPDLLALAARACGTGALPVVEGAGYVAVLLATGWALGDLHRSLSPADAPRGPGRLLTLLLLCALPVALLGESRLLHPALLSRTLALPLLIAGLSRLLAGDAHWAGLLAGLCLAVHPASALGLCLSVALASPRGLPALALGALPIAPWALLGADAAAPAPLLRLRLGHHLDPRDMAPIGAVSLLASLAGCWAARRLPSAEGRARLDLVVLAHLALLVAGMIGALAEVAPIMRLHTAYAGSALWVLGAAGAARAPKWAGAGALALALLAPIPGGRWSAAAPPRLAAPLQQRPEPVLRDDPWARVERGEPLWLTIKDGGEVSGGRGFSARWAARLRAACGDQVLEPPREEEAGAGWIRLRARCPRAASAPLRPR
jgi:hypothetical protein